VVGTGWVDSVFVGNGFPEFGTDLVTALTGLKMDDFSHIFLYVCACGYACVKPLGGYNQVTD
jgi:hypothetical protein